MSKMDRRNFMKLTSAAGLASAIPGLGNTSRAEVPGYDGPLYICIQATGGWDPTSLCDPKGRYSDVDEFPMNMYRKEDIGEIGNLKYAPVPGLQAFFEKYYDRLLVVNGVDTQTNGHDSGRRNCFSGNLIEGYPSFGALVSASKSAQMPMGFITNGGYDDTGGLTAKTRVGNTNVLTRLAYPNKIVGAGGGGMGGGMNGGMGGQEPTFHSEAAQARISALRAQRLAAMRDNQKLPRYRHGMGMLFGAQSSENQLTTLTDYLPDTLDNSGNPLRRQAQVAIACYKAGLTVSANLAMGGFDTHGNHDASHFPRMGQIVDGVDFLLTQAEEYDMADKIVIMVGSDFGRTPGYNGNNGKDHWSITSMFFVGAGVPGNRVVGGSDDGHVAYRYNPETLEQDDNGIRILPSHVHKAFRQATGIMGEVEEQAFPLDVDLLPIFT